MTVMTGASGIQVILVQHRWKEDFLLRKEFEIPGVSMPNFELVGFLWVFVWLFFVLLFFWFCFFTLMSYETMKKHNVDFKKINSFK